VWREKRLSEESTAKLNFNRKREKIEGEEKPPKKKKGGKRQQYVLASISKNMV